MKYHKKQSDAEWMIEPSNGESWVLKEKEAADWRSVGTFKTPNEAAVTVGAKHAATPGCANVHLARLDWVLSSWEAI